MTEVTARPLPEPAKDPICGMTVSTDKHHSVYEGRDYYFCGAGCRRKFEANPSAILDGEAARSLPAPPDAIFTCPMHPEVEQVGPGDCPSCGMALEPKMPTLNVDNTELRDMQRRFGVAALLSLPLVAISMIDMLPAHPISTALGWEPSQRHWVGTRFGHSRLSVGRVAISRSRRPISALGQPHMFTLIGLGVVVAFGYSLVALLIPQAFPDAFRGPAGEVAVYFEAAAVIVTLVLLGQVLELRARSQTSTAIAQLMNLAPETARVVDASGHDTDVPLDQVSAGQQLRVRPGDRVPVDGSVVDGRTNIDESMITGEPTPVTKEPGDRVVAGTLNGNGAFIMLAEAVGSETTLARIATLVAEAQRSRAPVQQLADRIAAYFVPAVLLTAVITFAVWALVGPAPAMGYGLVNAIAVLVIACPCALGLATPMSIMVASGRGATLGVLFRNAEAIEALKDVDTLVVDENWHPHRGFPIRYRNRLQLSSEENVLRWAAAVEAQSAHPLAEAITQAAVERSFSSPPPADSKTSRGKAQMPRSRAIPCTIGNAAHIERTPNRYRSAPKRRGTTTIPLATPPSMLHAKKNSSRSGHCRQNQSQHPNRTPRTATPRLAHHHAHRRRCDDGKGRCQRTRNR